MTAGDPSPVPVEAKAAGTLRRSLLLPLMVYAAGGLILSLTVHLLSFFGLQPGGTTLFGALHAGIFPLWFAVVLISRRSAGVGWLTGAGWRRNYWQEALSGCPPWMKHMTYGFFIYAILNFILFAATAPTGKPLGGAPPSSVWHGFSGHWMAFYSAGLAVLTSAYRNGFSTAQRKCPNGHAVELNDQFCGTCGAPLEARRR